MLPTKSQKKWMAVIAIVALILGLVVIVPFKSFSQASNIFKIEMLVKLVAIPVIILLISVFPNKLKYIQVKGYREQSRIVSVVSYFPAVVYLCALISESIYLLAQGYVLNGSAPLGTTPWNLWYVALIVDLVIFLIAIRVFPKYEEQLDVKEHVILDACVFVLIVCFGLMYLLVSKGTNEVFLAAGKKGDPILLLLYAFAVIGFICETCFISKTVKADEVNVNIHLNDISAASFAARTAEYNRAYNDIMANFENYFVEDGEIDIQEIELVDEDEEETSEQPQEEQVVAGAEVAETAEEAEQAQEQVQEEAPAEEAEQAQEEAPAEEAEQVQEETPAEEAEQAQEEAPAEEAEQVQEEAQPAEEPQEEQAQEEAPVQNEELEKKQEEAAKLEAEVEELRKAKEAEALAKAEAEAAKIAAREEAARLAEEKALKNKEEMQPTFAKLVAHAKGLEGVSCVEDKEKRQARFLINRKVFLIMTDTDKDYRLQFVNDPLKVVSWWAENSEIRPRSNKVDNWFKLTNKGTFTEQLLFTIIDSSREFMASEQERIAEEKKAQKAAAKQAAKEAAEKEKAKADAAK